MQVRAVRVAQYKGVWYYRWPVKVTVGETASITQRMEDYLRGRVTILAPTARDAGLFVKNILRKTACVEILVLGPKGGKAWYSYCGWYSAIASAMFDEPPRYKQLLLPFKEKSPCSSSSETSTSGVPSACPSGN